VPGKAITAAGGGSGPPPKQVSGSLPVLGHEFRSSHKERPDQALQKAAATAEADVLSIQVYLARVREKTNRLSAGATIAWAALNDALGSLALHRPPP